MDDLDFEKLAIEAAAAEPVDRKKAELALYHAYKKSPAPETFQPLYRSFKPFIYKAAMTNMVRSPIPQSAHTMLAANSFLDALRTFDPTKGASLHTHVHRTVQEKGKRLNYKYQNIGYIPESRATKYQLFQNTENQLKDYHGREPSTLELADELKWSPKMVETLRKETRKSLVLNEALSEGKAISHSNKAVQMFQDIQYQLSPPHQLVLEYVAELNGRVAPTKKGGGTDLGALAKQTKLTVPQIRSALKTITRKAREYRGSQIIDELVPDYDAGEDDLGPG